VCQCGGWVWGVSVGAETTKVNFGHTHQFSFSLK
jgi:hypothetical protein